MTNPLTYPCKIMRITQNYSGTTSHKPHWNGARDYKDYPIDEGGVDGGRDWFYCPCDEIKIVKIYGVGNSGVNTVWLESTSKVNLACGTEAYVCIQVTHPNDDDLKNLKVGQTFTRGTKMFREGMDGATGNHFHISVGKGKMTSGGWDQNTNGKWVLRTTEGCYYPQSAFFVDTSFTVVKSSNGIKFKTLPKEEAKVSTVKTTNKTSEYSSTPEYFNSYYKKGRVYAVKAIGGLRLRKSPVSGDIITVLSNNSKVTWYGYYSKINNKNWFYVECNGKSGFVSQDYLK